jgi:hypothetical protein
MGRRTLVCAAAVLALSAFAGWASPASADTSHWAAAAIASSEYGGSFAVNDPTHRLPVGGAAVGTSQCTQTIEGLINGFSDVDGTVEGILGLVFNLLGLGSPPDLPDINLPPVDLPDGCTPAVGTHFLPNAAADATGRPDTYPSCGDIPTAWAPQTPSDNPEFIDTLHGVVRNAKRVDIYETNLGGFVTQVDVLLASGKSVTVFNGPDTTPCPGILSIPLSGHPTVVGVSTHTQIPGWEEIDAVNVVS